MKAGGFDAKSWREVKVFTGRLAGPADVQAGLAVFALADTDQGEAFEDPLPQPAIWYDDDAQHGVLIVQAEVHDARGAAGEVERLEVLGLLLPDGQTRIGFTEDVEEVDPADPAWLALLDLAMLEPSDLQGLGDDADADEAE